MPDLYLLFNQDVEALIFDSFLDSLFEINERDLNFGQQIFNWLLRPSGLPGLEVRSALQKIDRMGELPPFLSILVRDHINYLRGVLRTRSNG